MRPIVTTGQRRQRLAEGAIIAVYCAIVVYFAIVFVRYSLGAFMASFNSDSAANVLFAQEMIAQHTAFPQWNNSTSIFFPLTMPNLAVLPLALAFISDWFAAFRVAVIIDQAFMLGLIWWVLGRAGLARVGRLFVVAFLLIGPSFPFAWQTTLLAGKSWSFAFVLLLAWFAWRIVEASAAAARWRWIALLVGIGGLVFVDSANAATIIPGLGVALAAQWLSDEDGRSRSGCVIAIGTLLGAVVLGRLILQILLRGGDYAPFEVDFTAVSEAGDHLRLLLHGMIELFGAVPKPGTSPYSLAGAASGAKFVMLLAVLGAPVYFALRHDRLQNRFARLLAVACSISLVIRIYVYLFTGISVGITGTARYFIVELLLGIVVWLFYLQQRLGERWVRDIVVLALIVPFALTAPLLAQSVGAPTKDQILARDLAAKGLDLGYAGFWNANAPTAISSGKVKVRPIEFANASIEPRRWLSSNRWYVGDPSACQSFLLLDAHEVKTTDLSALQAVVGDPERTIDIARFTAWVYPFDLATRLGWGHAMDRPLDQAQRHAEVTQGDNPPRVDAGRRALITQWRVRNLGNTVLSSFGRYPVNLGMHLEAANGKVTNFDLARQPIPALPPGESADVRVAIPLARLTGGSRIQGDLVQEGVAWFGDRGNATAEIVIPSITPLDVPTAAANDESARGPAAAAPPTAPAHSRTRRKTASGHP